MKLSQFISCLIVLLLVSCGPKGAHLTPSGLGGNMSGGNSGGSSNAGSGGGGTIDGGGGNGLDGKVFESYIVKVDEQQYYNTYIAPIISNLDKLGFVYFENQLLYAVKHKRWYIAPVDLPKISKDQLGVTFDNSEQHAIQNLHEVWIDSKFFNSNKDENGNILDEKAVAEKKARLIFHELVRGANEVKFVSYKSIQEIQNRPCDSCSKDEKKITLTQQDYINTRTMTDFLWNNLRELDVSKLKPWDPYGNTKEITNPLSGEKYWTETTDIDLANEYGLKFEIYKKINDLGFNDRVRQYLPTPSKTLSQMAKLSTVDLMSGMYDQNGRAHATCKIQMNTSSLKVDFLNKSDKSEISSRLFDLSNSSSNSKSEPDIYAFNLDLDSDSIQFNFIQTALVKILMPDFDTHYDYAVIRHLFLQSNGKDYEADLIYSEDDERLVSLQIVNRKNINDYIQCTGYEQLPINYAVQTKEDLIRLGSYEKLCKRAQDGICRGETIPYYPDGIYLSTELGKDGSRNYIQVQGNKVENFYFESRKGTYALMTDSLEEPKFGSKEQLSYWSCDEGKVISKDDQSSYFDGQGLYLDSSGDLVGGEYSYKKLSTAQIQDFKAKLKSLKQRCVTKEDLDE